MSQTHKNQLIKRKQAKTENMDYQLNTNKPLEPKKKNKKIDKENKEQARQDKRTDDFNEKHS